MKMGRLPNACPSCAATLRATRLACPSCSTIVEGNFELCPICSLGPDDRSLLDLFLSARGNAKEIQRSLKVSYPTARARLDQLWGRMKLTPAPPQNGEGRSPVAILDDLREGRITVDQAELLLRNRSSEGV
jgi:hypothetical protein